MAGAAFRLALLVVVVFYNWTEATLRSVSNTWLLFFLVGLDLGVISRDAKVSDGSKGSMQRERLERLGAPSKLTWHHRGTRHRAVEARQRWTLAAATRSVDDS
jgi:hypothetical protein